MIRLGRRLSPLVPFSLAAALAGCAGGSGTATQRPIPGTSGAPREVNIIARDYRFDPDPVDLAPGETVLLHLINGGLEVHEVVIGDDSVQAAWEAAEAATADAPPGPTPVVSVAPESAGLRVVLRSGERADVRWNVPPAPSPLVVGCHIPDHWAKGMRAAVRILGPGG
jgi:FtsP/CotA-like multicopper oxidase with cupredoxin domain